MKKLLLILTSFILIGCSNKKIEDITLEYQDNILLDYFKCDIDDIKIKYENNTIDPNKLELNKKYFIQTNSNSYYVTFLDRTKPIIIADTSFIAVYQNEQPYVPTITILDNFDKHISINSIKEIDTSIIGKQYIDITCSDSSYNFSTTKIIYDVREKNELSNGIYKGKEFYVDYQKADTSKGILTLVNKLYKLDEDYIPDDLVDIDMKYSYSSIKKSLNNETYKHLVEMIEDASKSNIEFKINSTFRSYNYQNYLYTTYSNQYGIVETDKVSARPGFSEHQLGYAIDLAYANGLLIEEDSLHYKWLIDNCYKYGFIIRYPKDKTDITGYNFEPWHIRYVSKDVASEIKNLNITFEEYWQLYTK